MIDQDNGWVSIRKFSNEKEKMSTSSGRYLVNSKQSDSDEVAAPERLMDVWRVQDTIKMKRGKLSERTAGVEIVLVIGTGSYAQDLCGQGCGKRGQLKGSGRALVAFATLDEKLVCCERRSEAPWANNWSS